jgi:hypothetical protein
MATDGIYRSGRRQSRTDGGVAFARRVGAAFRVQCNCIRSARDWHRESAPCDRPVTDYPARLMGPVLTRARYLLFGANTP